MGKEQKDTKADPLNVEELIRQAKGVKKRLKLEERKRRRN